MELILQDFLSPCLPAESTAAKKAALATYYEDDPYQDDDHVSLAPAECAMVAMAGKKERWSPVKRRSSNGRQHQDPVWSVSDCGQSHRHKVV